MTQLAGNSLSAGAKTAAKDHLWMHFTPQATEAEKVRMMTRGEGAYVYDAKGKRYLDGLAGLFVTQVGHGRTEIAQAMSRQAEQLSFFPLWGFANEPAAQLAERLADLAPGDINKVFFTNSGSEAVESAWKLAKQYFRTVGKPNKHKVLSRSVAYHGTTQGALSITALPDLKEDFEPLVPSTHRVPNTNFYRAPEYGDDLLAFGAWAAREVERAILAEGPDTVAAVFLEPVQNSGGCFPPPPNYFRAIRDICDRYDVLLVSDEVITGFGRLGTYFGAQKYDFVPDIMTVAKGLTSGYAPMGAMLASDRLFEAVSQDGSFFKHGYTFGGHPVAAAAALANLDIFEQEGLNQHVLDNEAGFRATLEKLLDLPIVGDVRGDGYFYGIELVRDKTTKETFNEEESTRILKNFVSERLFSDGLYCRADDRGEPVIQLSPPLIVGQEQFTEMEQILRGALTDAWKLL